LNLRWHEDVKAARTAFKWDDSRGVCDRYRRWYAASARVLEQNRLVPEGTMQDARAETASALREACLKAMAPATVNVDDLEEGFDRLDKYNEAWTARSAATSGKT
jgi:hypothetical protein